MAKKLLCKKSGNANILMPYAAKPLALLSWSAYPQEQLRGGSAALWFEPFAGLVSFSC